MRLQGTYFMGANTVNGFSGFADQFLGRRDGWLCYLIKSGPGTGKSSLMKQFEALFAQKGYATARILCSSDPDSFDGVVVAEKQLVIMDATAPHIMEPRYWGVTERTIDLTPCLNQRELWKNRDEIVMLTDRCSDFHRQSRSHIRRASMLNVAAEAVEEAGSDPTVKRAERQIFQQLPRKKEKREAEEWRFFTDAVTPKGYCHLMPDNMTATDTVIQVFGNGNRALIDRIRQKALSRGYDVIAAPSPLSPDDGISHLLIPDQHLCITAEPFNESCGAVQTIMLSSINNPYAKAVDEAIQKAVDAVKQAKRTHDALEGHYVAAMDWDRYQALCDALVEEWGHF